jgi:hypothetical protein
MLKYVIENKKFRSTRQTLNLSYETEITSYKMN